MLSTVRLVFTRETLIFVPFLYYNGLLCFNGKVPSIAGTVLSMWQNKMAGIIGGHLVPGPALPADFQPKARAAHPSRHTLSAAVHWRAWAACRPVEYGQFVCGGVAGRQVWTQGVCCWFESTVSPGMQVDSLYSHLRHCVEQPAVCESVQRLDDAEVMCACMQH